MRGTLIVWAALFVLLACAGCASVAEWIAATKDTIVPVLAETLATSLAASLGEVVNRGAAGQPITPEVIDGLAKAFAGALEGGIVAGSKAAAAGGGAGAAFTSGLVGAVTGGIAGGAGGFAGGRMGRGGAPAHA